MAATLYGARVFRVPAEGTINYQKDAFGKNSEVFAENDIVGLTSGDLAVQTTTSVGVVTKTQTMASDNVTVAKVAPLYIPLYPSTLFLMGTNSDLTSNATDAGTYYKITGATGAQQVDVAAGAQTTTQRSVEIVQVDPFDIGGTGAGSGLRMCVVRFLKTPYYNISAVD